MRARLLRLLAWGIAKIARWTLEAAKWLRDAAARIEGVQHG